MRKLMIAAALLLVGCGAKSEVACDIVDTEGPIRTHRCSELASLDASQQQDAEDACPLLGGTLVDACSAQGQIGVCTLSSEGATQAIHFYADGGVTVTEAQATCKKLAGTWTGS